MDGAVAEKRIDAARMPASGAREGKSFRRGIVAGQLLRGLAVAQSPGCAGLCPGPVTNEAMTSMLMPLPKKSRNPLGVNRVM